MTEPESQPQQGEGQWWARTPAGQFGPIDLATLRLWVQQRRVGPNDFVSNTGTWVPAGGEPQLAGCFPPQGPPAPYAGPVAPSASRSNGCLIAAIVGGVVGFLCLLILAGMLLPALARAREQARRASCLSNVKQLGLAMKQYSQDFKEMYPWRVGAQEPENAWRDLGMLFPNYCSSTKAFYCPSSSDGRWDDAKVADKINRDPLGPFDMSGSQQVISYSYGHDSPRDGPKAWTEYAKSTVRMLADKKAGTEIGSPGNPVNLANHKDDGRNVLYQDGHVRWKAGERAIDPDEDDDNVGAPGAHEYEKWWSDPPYYGE